MRKCLCLLFAVAMFVWVTGCEDLDGDTGIDFVNASTYKVTVSPNGQDGWSQFILGSGQSREIDIDGDVYFLYSPSNRVRADTSEDNEVTFYNR